MTCEDRTRAGRGGLRKLFDEPARRKLAEIVKKRAPRMGARLVEQIFTALDARTVIVPAPLRPRRSGPG